MGEASAPAAIVLSLWDGKFEHNWILAGNGGWRTGVFVKEGCFRKQDFEEGLARSANSLEFIDAIGRYG
jgi:hypothetical protein